jgi:Tol biopolymer transport system component
MTARIPCLKQKIAFTSTRDFATIPSPQNAAEIYFMNPNGTGGERVTDNLVGDGFLKLRADGKRIVFDSNRRRTEAESALAPEKFLSRLRPRRHLVKNARSP